MRKVAIFILGVLLFSYALPLASAVTETQYSDGTSTFTHVFSQAGGTGTPGVTLPFGANVEDVEFAQSVLHRAGVQIVTQEGLSR